MVKYFKTSGAKRLLSLLLVLGLLASLAFNSSLSLAAKEEKEEHTHELIIHTEEILAALENGSTPLGDSSIGTTPPDDSGSPLPVIVPPGQSSPPGGSILAVVEQNRHPSAAAMSTAGSSEIPVAPGSSTTPGSSSVPGSSGTPGSPTTPGSSNSAPGGTPEVTKKTSLIDKIDVPFDSKTMKADLEKHLKDNLPVRLFDHGDIGCTTCQALVTVNTSTKKLSIIAINSSETETHTFKLSIVNEDNSPLKLGEVSQEVTSAEKKTFDGDIKNLDIPAGAEVEIIEVITGSASSSSSSSQPASSSETISSSSASSESGSSIGTKPSDKEALPVSRSFAKNAAAANTSHESAASEESSNTSSSGDSSASSSSNAGSEASSSTASSNERSSNTSSSASSEASSVASSSNTSSSSSSSSNSSSTGENRPADEVLKTVALLIQSETVSLGMQAYAGTALKVPSGITTLEAAQAAPPSLNSIHVGKSAEPVSESDRTYQVTLNAWADKLSVSPVDIVLVLDASGSMPWLTTKPSIQKTVAQLSTSPEHPYNQFDFSYYKYYVEVDNEYRPIEYLTGIPSGYSGSFSRSGWYRIESNSNGNKNLVGGVLSNNTVVYERDSSDKTKLEMLQQSATSFVNSVAAVSPSSKVGAVSFNYNSAVLSSMITMSASGASSVNASINAIHLTGGTRPDLGLATASTMLNAPAIKNDGRAKYLILFTDGQPNGGSSTEADAKTTAAQLKTAGVTIFSIGLYGGGITGSTLTNLESFLKQLATSNAHYYNANKSGLDNIFNTIFSNIAQGITGAVVTDVVNERFILTSGSRSALTAAGAVISTDSAGRDVVTWNNQSIPCTGEAASGWKKIFTIQAKEYYVGGNQVPTNSDGSQLTHPSNPSFARAFTSPLVDVSLRYSMNAKDGYFYIGDEIGNSTRLAGLYSPTGINWQTYGDTSIVYSAVTPSKAALTGRLTVNTPYLLSALITPVRTGKYTAVPFYSAQKTLYMLSPAITLTDTKIFSGEQTNLNNRASGPVWQYKTGSTSYAPKESEWVYAGSGNSDTPPALTYSFKNCVTNTPVTAPATVVLFEKTDYNIFTGRAGVPETFNLNQYVRYTNTSKTPQAQGSNGWFTVDVQLGTITVNKQISNNWEPHGDPIFVYKLDRLNASGGVEQSYNDFIRFTGGSTGERSIIFDKLPAGTYRLTELDTLRYQLQSIGAPNGTNISISGKSVDFSVSKTNKTPSATFVNIKVENRWFSDTDVVKNTFKVGSSTTTPR